MYHILLYLLFSLSLCARQESLILIESSPARGSAGRVVHQEFESYYSKKIGNFIKSVLVADPSLKAYSFSTLHVVNPSGLERIETINRAQPFLCIILTVYENTLSKNSIELYTYCQNSFSDHISRTSNDLFIPLEDTHKRWIKDSQAYANALYKGLAEQSLPSWLIHKPVGLPLRLLYGINAPCYGIELGLIPNQDLELLASSIAKALANALKNV